ncbi:MAG: isochorismatase family protein [Deltaproteobacteria bacterium]|nr:isochorismatase family protein [Deltaproteobacteria bacterium]
MRRKVFLSIVILAGLGLMFLLNDALQSAAQPVWAASTGEEVAKKGASTLDPFEDHCWKDVMSPEILEIYTAYKRDTYIGKRPALVAIDLYRQVFDGGPLPVYEAFKKFPSSCGINAWNAVKPIQEVFALARANKFPVFYTTGDARKQAKPKMVEATQRQTRSKDPGRGYEIMDEFKPEPQDVIITKQRASGFFGTPLAAHLVQLGIDTVIIVGESTSGCVRASVADAYSHGFHVVVVEEGVFDRSTLNHKVNLFDMHHKYADVMSLEEFKKHIEKRK